MSAIRNRPWNNSLFLGALADRNLIRLSLDGDRIIGEERLLTDLDARIRDVRVAPRWQRLRAHRRRQRTPAAPATAIGRALTRLTHRQGSDE
jgi:hypothetical protein